MHHRYGILRNGSKDVKGHEWYKGFDWDALMSKKIKPSYKPKVGSEGDTSNFDEYDEEPFRTCSVDEFQEEFSAFIVK